MRGHHPPTDRGGACCFVAPPDVLARLADEGSPEQRAAALRTLATSGSIRARRALTGAVMREPRWRRARADKVHRARSP
jgi:hypothetical protein